MQLLRKPCAKGYAAGNIAHHHLYPRLRFNFVLFRSGPGACEYCRTTNYTFTWAHVNAEYSTDHADAGQLPR